MSDPAEPVTSAANQPRVLPPAFERMKRDGRLIAMVTAYDAASARLADRAGVEGLLVGDSAGMTVLGHESTVPVTLDDMLMLTRAVTRARPRALVVADMPFGSFQVSSRAAVANAIRLVKDGGADAVKLEGAGRTLSRVRAIVGAGIPVMGHIGLTPQSYVQLGGYRPQGRTAASGQILYDQALSLERAGCFAIVLEAMAAEVASAITRDLRVPTIGIGAGSACDGQVLVWHDLMGLTEGRVPQFVKQYADLGSVATAALRSYVAEVRDGTFPEARHAYTMPPAERALFDLEDANRVQTPADPDAQSGRGHGTRRLPATSRGRL